MVKTREVMSASTNYILDILVLIDTKKKLPAINRRYDA